MAWSNKKKAAQIEPKINKYCQNRDELAKTVADPEELGGLIIDMLNDNEITNGYIQRNLSDLFIRYLGCKLIQEDDEQIDEHIHQIGIDFMGKPKTSFISYKEKPESEEMDKDQYELHLNLKRFYKNLSDEEIRDYKNSRTFEELLFNFFTPLPQMCPYLSEKCLESELRKNNQTPDSFCENLCVKLSEYDNDSGRLKEEMVMNSYKNWDNAEILSEENSQTAYYRLIMLYRFGGRDLLLNACDYVPAEKKTECVKVNRALSNRIEIFRRDLITCDAVPEKMVEWICGAM
ncbi:MAG: hypothetical protein V1867_00285 [Candidatus Falkowbacteria bacterium]